MVGLGQSPAIGTIFFSEVDCGLVCCDVDGTLVRDDGTLFVGVTSLVKALVARNWVVRSCTARSSKAARELARLVPEVQYIASLAGFHIAKRHTQGQWHTLVETPGFTPSQKTNILETLAEYGIEIWAYTSINWLVATNSGNHSGVQSDW